MFTLDPAHIDWVATLALIWIVGVLPLGFIMAIILIADFDEVWPLGFLWPIAMPIILFVLIYARMRDAAAERRRHD